MNILLFLLILILLGFFDFIYLSLFNEYFKTIFYNIQKSKLNVNLYYALGVYLIMTLCIYYFGFVKKLNEIDMLLLGLFIYGIYEFTNKATFKNWPIFMILLDTTWGGILFLSVFYISKYINKKLLKN